MHLSFCPPIQYEHDHDHELSGAIVHYMESSHSEDSESTNNRNRCGYDADAEVKDAKIGDEHCPTNEDVGFEEEVETTESK